MPSNHLVVSTPPRDCRRECLAAGLREPLYGTHPIPINHYAEATDERAQPGGMRLSAAMRLARVDAVLAGLGFLLA